jgi:hypothetical protein
VPFAMTIADIKDIAISRSPTGIRDSAEFTPESPKTLIQ